MDSSKKEFTAQQFGKVAENYVVSAIHAKGQDLKKLVEISEVNSETYLLDIATGGGHVANIFAPIVNKIIAYDLAPEMLQAAKSFLHDQGQEHVQFVLGDAEKLPFESNQFTHVACRIAAHHFPDVEQFIKESTRVLQPNGIFLLIDNVAPENELLDLFYSRKNERSESSSGLEKIRMAANDGETTSAIGTTNTIL